MVTEIDGGIRKNEWKQLEGRKEMNTKGKMVDVVGSFSPLNSADGPVCDRSKACFSWPWRRFGELEEDDFSAFGDENEGDDLRSLGQDIQNEDNEHMVYENIEDYAQQSDNDDDIGDRDDELVEEQIESIPSQQASELSITKKRGPTMMHGVQKRCLIAKDVRMSQKNMHTAGPKSFARIHEEMMNDDPNKEPPTLAQMFERTRRRTVGNKYVDTYDDTANKIEQMKNYKPSEDGSAPLDPFLATMGKEYDGHHRLFRRGVTNRLMNKVNGDGTSYMVPRELMDSLRANAEKDQLLDMRKELDEDHARKMDELEEDHASKKAELEAMRNDIDKVVEDAMQRLIEKLPAGVAREFLT
ncbi:unnamed protein product [Lactuca saligna]|uniref:Uncharacterized protein n=1 Tax=Lactuca saligna TaxID=75948 RepID=A0AA36EPL5_LACSI|nr:unnamed protein product [Lactuca saligna]